MVYNMLNLKQNHTTMWKYFRDILITIVIAIALFFLLQTITGAFKVYGTSSYPNIQPGDYILLDKISYHFRDPQRGEMIILHGPDKNSDLIKRVIGLPGETVEVRDGKVFINDKPLNEPYIREAPRYIYEKQTVPEKAYFVLGDNRNVAIDSHSGWFLPRKDIMGRAWIIYWPPYRWQVVKHYTYDIDRK